MAHFAKIDDNNIVVQVVVVSNDTATDEQAGITFLQNLYNDTATWKQTSYNTFQNTHRLGETAFRGNYAGNGYIWDADNKINNLAKLFEIRRNEPGRHYRIAKDAEENLEFKGVELHLNNCRNSPPINPRIFYHHLGNSIQDRLLNSTDSSFINACKILDPTTWPEDTVMTHGENEIIEVAKRLRLDEREAVRGLREYVTTKKRSQSLQIS